MVRKNPIVERYTGKTQAGSNFKHIAIKSDIKPNISKPISCFIPAYVYGKAVENNPIKKVRAVEHKKNLAINIVINPP